MSTKIKKLTIEYFRGIPGTISIDFVAGSPLQPVSLVLCGDNGTGKSSVADALEFALQGRIRRKAVTPHSFAVNDKNPKVSVELADGSIVNRQLLFHNNKWHSSSTQPDDRFSISPFVLTRADILRFIDTPDIEKQVLFLDYFKGAIGKKTVLSQSAEEQKQKLTQELEINYLNRGKSIIKLATFLKVLPDEIPADTSKFEMFVTEKVYNGIEKQERDKLKKQGKLTIPRYINSQIRDIRSLFKEISRLKREIKTIEKQGLRTDTSTIQSILSDASAGLTKAFKELSPRNFVKEIELIFGKLSEVSLTMSVHLTNDKICSPQQIFSEANLDLLALLVFTSVLKEAGKRGQSKLLVLDDVFQSVDASIRVSVIDYLVKEFSDWQLVFTLHDRLWKNQLREILRKNGHQFIERDIVKWTFQDGPTISSSKELKDLLADSISRGESISICAHTGLLLESICDRLSWSLSTSMSRKKDDKYTLGDLWPGLAKALKKSSIKSQVEVVEKWIHLRNIAGAHFNEWALSLPLDDAINFANSVLSLYDSVFCNSCFSWIEPLGEGKYGYRCRCGTINITIPKIDAA